MRNILFAIGATVSLPVVNMKAVNFVVINLDDAGYGDFSCYGATGYSTPNIDRMAAEGMRFTHFLTAQPISGASRAGLLTGCYPNRFGFAGAPGPNSPTGIHANEMTMGELLKQKGYHTAIYGKWHLGDAEQFLPLQNGFDEYYGLPYSNDMRNKILGGLPLYDNNDIVALNPDRSKLTGDYTARAITFIRKNKDRPFFVYLAHNMPHVPLAVSDRFKGKSKQGLYGDVMMEIDQSVGDVITTLRELNLEEETLVILTSDNGPWINYGNHAGSTGGLREAKATTFEGGNRVPCIMYRKNKIAPGTICNLLASTIDIFPTIAELSNAPLPKHTIDGVSLTWILDGRATESPRRFFAYYFHKNDLEAVTDGIFKLIFPHKHRTYGAFPSGADGKGGKTENIEITMPELYDLRRDPGERYNVIEQYPEAVSRLTAFADSMRRELGDDLTASKGANRRPLGKTLAVVSPTLHGVSNPCRGDGTTSLRGTKQSSVPFPSGLLPFFRIASNLIMTNALSVNARAMTDVSSKPLAGFKTTARVRGTVISTLNSQLSTLNLIN
jgi:arylsulfatase